MSYEIRDLEWFTPRMYSPENVFNASSPFGVYCVHCNTSGIYMTPPTCGRMSQHVSVEAAKAAANKHNRQMMMPGLREVT